MCARCSAGRRGINCWYCQSKGDILKANLSPWLILQVVERVWNKGYTGVGRCPAHQREQNQKPRAKVLAHGSCRGRSSSDSRAGSLLSLSSHLQHPLLAPHQWPGHKILEEGACPQGACACMSSAPDPGQGTARRHRAESVHWSQGRAAVVNGRNTALGSRHCNASLHLNQMLPEMNLLRF